MKRFDLEKILLEIPDDEGKVNPKEKNISQSEIQQLLAEKRKTRNRSGLEDDKKP